MLNIFLFSSKNYMTIKKRKNYISRDEYFMWIAILSWQRSKDPNTQVWACIVDENKRIIWIWYNWLPNGCNDDNYPREREWEMLNTKYAYIVHAEANAILNSTKNLKWSTIYVVQFPCNECAKLIIQSWIKNVIYLSDKHIKNISVQASMRMFKDSWVNFSKLKTKNKQILIDLS